MKRTKRLLRISVLAPALMVSHFAFGAAGWSDFGQVVEVNEQPAAYGAGAGQVFIELQITANPSACSYPSGFYFTVHDERTKRFYATLLAAQLASKTVSIWTTGTCHVWGFAELDGLRVR